MMAMGPWGISYAAMGLDLCHQPLDSEVHEEGGVLRHRPAVSAVGENSINLLLTPLPLLGVSIVTGRGCQLNGRTLAIGDLR